ncbi:MAG: deoxynucleoside kinase [Chloroflexi bacterium]|nr:deoxynucleoside kinase [Chloroflexota bacterium]
MADNPYIAIEGPIGVGKTTLARLMKDDFRAQLLLEVFEQNPFLSDFYADREKYAFQTQIFFLLSRYRQQHRAVLPLVGRSTLISDYMFAKDRLFAHLNLKGDELDVYERLHQELAENIPLPDLVVYLRADTDVLLERIAVRDRPYERAMSRQYIDDLRRAYENFFAEYRQTPVLPIDTNELDWVRNPDDLASVVARIRTALGQGTHQRPLPLGTISVEQPEVILQTSRRRLGDFQRLHRALGEERGFYTDLYFDFIGLQEEIGELASLLKRTWATQEALQQQLGNQEEAREEALRQNLPGLRQRLAESLAYLIRLANQVGVDLEDAYLEKMRSRCEGEHGEE